MPLGRSPAARRSRHALAALVVGGLSIGGCVESGETGLGLDLVPEDRVRQMGVESWQRIRSERPISDNQRYQRMADMVASDLLRAAGANPGEWEMVVFAGDRANAFALPGGKIGITEGMIEAADNEAQLAAVAPTRSATSARTTPRSG